jgi:hypothetical protein
MQAIDAGPASRHKSSTLDGEKRHIAVLLSTPRGVGRNVVLEIKEGQTVD